MCGGKLIWAGARRARQAGGCAARKRVRVGLPAGAGATPDLACHSSSSQASLASNSAAAATPSGTPAAGPGWAPAVPMDLLAHVGDPGRAETGDRRAGAEVPPSPGAAGAAGAAGEPARAAGALLGLGSPAARAAARTPASSAPQELALHARGPPPAC